MKEGKTMEDIIMRNALIHKSEKTKYEQLKKMFSFDNHFTDQDGERRLMNVNGELDDEYHEQGYGSFYDMYFAEAVHQTNDNKEIVEYLADNLIALDPEYYTGYKVATTGNYVTLVITVIKK